MSSVGKINTILHTPLLVDAKASILQSLNPYDPTNSFGDDPFLIMYAPAKVNTRSADPC
jgi:hypothetical protein